MNKVAILVIGAKAPKVLGRVLDLFDDVRFRFFLHVDAKINLDAYRKELGHDDRLTLIEPRIPVFWGGYSMIEVELALLREALADPDVVNLVLWSDDTAPLRAAEEIYQSLMKAPDRISNEVRDYTQEWYTKFYFGDSNFTSFVKHMDPRDFGTTDWENLKRLQLFTQRGKKDLKKVFFSRQWWSLSRDSATTILRYIQQDEHLVDSFRYSLFPDEIFFATLYQLCGLKADVSEVPMFADYERPPVPFIYTWPRDLPDPRKVPPKYLFFRKIWPWSTDLVDRMASQWKVDAKPPAAETAANVPAPKLEDYEARRAAAVEAREDGELETSVKLFEILLEDFPEKPELVLDYVATLRKLRRYTKADEVLDAAMVLHPTHFGLRHAWADLPTKTLDHSEVIRRGAIFHAAFPPMQHPGAWHSLAFIYGSFAESLRWEELCDDIVARREELVQDAHGFRIGLWQATELCLIEPMKAMVAAAKPEAWRQLPGEAKENTGLRIEMAELNRQLLHASDVKVIPIGQNCLPYLLGGRWGMIADRERPEAASPFDRGAFQKDNAAAVIDTDFATFSDRFAFSETGVYDGSRMFRHEASGVYFYHERGPFWMKDDGARFFSRLEQMIEAWRRTSVAGRRLFVFCLCGEGNLNTLVAAMNRRLLGPDAHLLIIDVLQQPHECPTHDRVTYWHSPYPADYAWDNFAHQCAARGVAFELGVVAMIFDHLLSYLGEAEAVPFIEGRRRLLRKAAAASASWKRDHPNAAALYEALHKADPASPQVALAYARALRDSHRTEDAQKVLVQARELYPTNYDVWAAWAEAGVAPFDWTEKLTRLRLLRGKFPIETEPRSWHAVFQELKTLNEHGGWDESIALISEHWSGFTTKPDMFQGALGTFVQLGCFQEAHRLIDDATPNVRKALPGHLLDGVLRRLDIAERNRMLVDRSNVTVMPLGQTGCPTILIYRWGLAGLRKFNNSTPFELGDFYGNTAAEAIADEFTSLADHTSYVEKPAWGGGKTLRHTPSDVAFLIHRNAQIGAAEKGRFFSHLDRMISCWRNTASQGRRVYIYFHTDGGNLSRLVEVAKEKLLGPEAKLVVIDQNIAPAQFAQDENVVLLHAPPPPNYPWFNALGSATPESMEYEQRVLAPVIEIVKQMGLVAEEVSAMSDP